MTRKQALIYVCGVLDEREQSDEIKEAKKKMLELIGEMPLTAWSKDTIFDTFNQWIIENNRIPNTKDMARKGLPPIPVIKNRFGLNGTEFIKTYYPRNTPKCKSRIYGHKTKEEWLGIFKAEYMRIKPSSAVEFNLKRGPQNPTWATYAQIFEIHTWNKLLSYCKLERHERKIFPQERKVVKFNISRQVDIQQELDKIEKDI